MTNRISYSQFAAARPGKTLSWFEAGLEDFAADNEDGYESLPALDVLVYDNEDDADADSDQGVNTRAVERATVVNDLEDVYWITSTKYSADISQTTVWDAMIAAPEGVAISADGAHLYADSEVIGARQGYATLSPRGQKLVRDWVESLSDSEAIQADAFFSDAEAAANDAGPAQDIVIEMSARLALDDAPHTLSIPRSMFRW